MITQEEVWAFNIINTSAQNAQAELQRITAARGSYIKLLEEKYKATFDAETGHFDTYPQKANTRVRGKGKITGTYS